MPDFLEAGSDFLSKSTILRRHGIPRVFFDPTNQAHLESLRHYLQTGNWIQQFYPEDPFTDVPMTVFRKYIGHNLNVSVTAHQKDEAAMAQVIQLKGRHDPTSSAPQPQQYDSRQNAAPRGVA